MKVKCDKKDCPILSCSHKDEHSFDDDCNDDCSEFARYGCKPTGSMIVYIAGPMSDNDHATYENFNFDLFDQVRDYLKAAGHHPISPADIDRLFEGWDKYPPEGFEPTPDDVARYMRRDLNAIEGADAVYMMEGWEHSKGARNEKAFAEFLGKQVLIEVERML